MKLCYNPYHHQVFFLLSILNLTNRILQASRNSDRNKMFEVEAQLLAEQDPVKPKRKLQKLIIQEGQFKLQRELENTEVLERIKNREKIVKMLEKRQEKQICKTSSYCSKVGNFYRIQKTTQRDT